MKTLRFIIFLWTSKFYPQVNASNSSSNNFTPPETEDIHERADEGYYGKADRNQPTRQPDKYDPSKYSTVKAKDLMERWDAKYIIGYETAKLIQCSGGSDGPHGEILVPPRWEQAERAKREIEKLLESPDCVVTLDKKPLYKMCDTESRTTAACIGEGINKTYFETYGYPGQDCESSRLLESYVQAGGPDISNMEHFCKPNSRRLVQLPGCQEDGHAAPGGRSRTHAGYDKFWLGYDLYETQVSDLHFHFHNAGHLLGPDALSVQWGKSCSYNHFQGAEWNRPIHCQWNDGSGHAASAPLYEASWSSGGKYSLIQSENYGYPMVHLGGKFDGMVYVEDTRPVTMTGGQVGCMVLISPNGRGQHNAIVTGNGNNFCTFLTGSTTYSVEAPRGWRPVCNCDPSEPPFDEGTFHGMPRGDCG